MWSQSYQDECLKMNTRVFDSYPTVVGEQVWNFADFQTTEGIIGWTEKKKASLQDNWRQPKAAAFRASETLGSLPPDYKNENNK